MNSTAVKNGPRKKSRRFPSHREFKLIEGEEEEGRRRWREEKELIILILNSIVLLSSIEFEDEELIDPFLVN